MINDSAHHLKLEEKHSFELQRSHIILTGGVELEGTFGCVYHGTLQIPGLPSKEIVVKTAKSIFLIIQHNFRFIFSKI